LWVRSGAYPREEHLKGASIGKALALPRKHWARLEKLARDKCSSLLQKLVTHGRKKFYNIGPCSARMGEA